MRTPLAFVITASPLSENSIKLSKLAGRFGELEGHSAECLEWNADDFKTLKTSITEISTVFRNFTMCFGVDHEPRLVRLRKRAKSRDREAAAKCGDNEATFKCATKKGHLNVGLNKPQLNTVMTNSPLNAEMTNSPLNAGMKCSELM